MAANSTSMRGKICMVTGANAGLGQATALGLAKLGATVVVVCRDRARGEAARADIQAASGNAAVVLLIADLAAQSSIRQLARDFRAQYPRLDVLVNNAAVFKSERSTTVDGVETMFATNHLAPFLLTNLLLDSLKASGAARVLNITAPSTVKVEFDNLQGERRFGALSAFGASKMANLLFTFELARRLAGTRVAVNAIHPGLARTNLMREANPLMRFVTRLFSPPAERATEGIVRVATALEFAEASGRFYHNGKEIKADVFAYDANAQKQLWQVSAELTKLAVA